MAFGVFQLVEWGGAKGTRTPDPLLAKQVLFQLSYSPKCSDLPNSGQCFVLDLYLRPVRSPLRSPKLLIFIGSPTWTPHRSGSCCSPTSTTWRGELGHVPATTRPHRNLAAGLSYRSEVRRSKGAWAGTSMLGPLA
jgi:hypothetical protein